MTRCLFCKEGFKKEYLQWPRNGRGFCPTCLKELIRNEDLICLRCGYKAPIFFVDKITCYSIRWQCPICDSNDVIDPDCTPTVDEEIISFIEN